MSLQPFAAIAISITGKVSRKPVVFSNVCNGASSKLVTPSVKSQAYEIEFEELFVNTASIGAHEGAEAEKDACAPGRVATWIVSRATHPNGLVAFATAINVVPETSWLRYV